MKPNCPPTCPLINCGPPVPPDGPAGGLLCVGEAPGEKEVKVGHGFAGIAGRNLDNALASAGLGREQWARTNTVWCRPRDGQGRNRKPTALESECCRPNMLAAISTLKPKVVLCVGESAARAVCDFDGGFMPHVERQNAGGVIGKLAIDGLEHRPGVVAMPHTSPLSWNMRRDGKPVKEIGQEAVRLAVATLGEAGVTNNSY